MIELNSPKTLTLTPNTISLMLDALADRPFRYAQPAIEEIISQLKKEPQNEQSAASSSGSVSTPLGYSNDGSSSALNGAGVWSNGVGSEIRDTD